MLSDPRALLDDIDRAGADIMHFIKGMYVEFYLRNALTQAAVVCKFEIIGEALNPLDSIYPELTEKISGFYRIIDFRNLLIHCYSSVNAECVWDYAENHLPGLRHIVQELTLRVGIFNKWLLIN